MDTQDFFQLKTFWKAKKIVTRAILVYWKERRLQTSLFIFFLFPLLPQGHKDCWDYIAIQFLVNTETCHLLGCVSMLMLKTVSHTEQLQEQQMARTSLSFSIASMP